MLNKKDIVYYARIIPKLGVYEICELIVRTIGDTWFVGIDKRDKRAYLINNNELNKTVFKNRKDALEKVRDAEEEKEEIIGTEIFYDEEYDEGDDFYD